MSETNRVTCFQCDSWDDFRVQVRGVRGKVFGRRIYRGQRDLAWLLSSVFERWLRRRVQKDEYPERSLQYAAAHGSIEGFRDDYRKRFEALAAGLPGMERQSLGPDDWWILGRHHGLITPLLDWTLSPYVAAFFALVDYGEHRARGFKDGLVGLGLGEMPVNYSSADRAAVWSLALAEGLEVRDEFEVIRPQIPFSFYSNRHRAQQSMFTRLSHDVHADVESYLRSREIAHYLERYEISGEALPIALKDLTLMNITFETMFPDFEGAARSANFDPTLSGFMLEE